MYNSTRDRVEQIDVSGIATECVPDSININGKTIPYRELQRNETGIKEESNE